MTAFLPSQSPIHSESSSPCSEKWDTRTTPTTYAVNLVRDANPSVTKGTVHKVHQTMRTMDPVSSTNGTSQQSLSQLLSSSASLHFSTIDGGRNPDAEEHMSRSIGKVLNHLSPIDHFQLLGSSLKLGLENQAVYQSRLWPKQISKRRCISADVSSSARTRFTSPDRYSALRTHLSSPSSPLRTGRPADELRGRERYQRHRDFHTNPFHASRESKSRAAVRRFAARNTGRGITPHYTPSFVHGQDATPPNTNTRLGVGGLRNPSLGAIWTVGGRFASVSPVQLAAIETGRGDSLVSGSNAPMQHTNFLDQLTYNDKLQAYERRLALALDIDQAQRVLPVFQAIEECGGRTGTGPRTSAWENSICAPGSNIRAKQAVWEQSGALRPEKSVPTVAFRVLDAPRLKDDYYCSILAYNHTCRTLAVALTHRVYLWTEKHGVRYPPLRPVRPANYVSSLAFSSESGGRAILAIARNSGHVTLWSLLEQKARFEAPHPWAACCVSFRPTTAKRYSIDSQSLVSCEDLLVGDDSGCVYYYSVEWPEIADGSMTLLVKLDAHSQNVCGLAWSPDGLIFVSGGNDNIALTFDTRTVLQSSQDDLEVADLSSSPTAIQDTSSIGDPTHGFLNDVSLPTPPLSPGADEDFRGRPIARQFLSLGETAVAHSPPRSQSRLRNKQAAPNVAGQRNAHRYSFLHAAAVKAIAFAPWQNSLVATGGGSNDRQIHFYHTSSGTTLAVINVFAQVTSLVWSTTRRELAATFGYAQPEHQVRIAIFAWPSCKCIVSIPWERKSNGEIGRALWAIPYPGGPNDAASERLQDTEEGFNSWEALRTRTGLDAVDARRERDLLGPASAHQDQQLSMDSPPPGIRSSHRSRIRSEGAAWASRTEEEGSLIIACCDQTVKFFEVWGGKSKGRTRGLGAKEGVLGGSKVLEGWSEGIGIEEVGQGEEVIR